jgi:putative cardiolipin synthase
LGLQFTSAAQLHSGSSGFRIITAGVDGFLARMQLIDAAERTLDLQYYIYRGDQTGRLLTDALLRAADRGVRIRVLVDDGDTMAGDEQIAAISGHRAVEVRVFNPFRYRGHAKLLRTIEFVFNMSRLDYRMHNKMLVADDAVALIGGRNIGNQYFQIDPDSQLADDDIFVAGPAINRLSAIFDEYWRSTFSIPVEHLRSPRRQATAFASRADTARARPSQIAQTSSSDGVAVVSGISTGDPVAGISSGRLPLVWAPALIISDSPDKKAAENGIRRGRLMMPTVVEAANASQSEVVMVTPYFIPAKEELQALRALRSRQVAVRILTNSLVSSQELSAQAHYSKYRLPLLADGVDIHEVRSLLGNTRGSGQAAALTHFGNYSLHAKLFVFDRLRLFMGSMNFDQRSKHLNTEVGVIIDSAELSKQTVARLDAMAQPANSYALSLSQGRNGAQTRLQWLTEENGKTVTYSREPARSTWQRLKAWLLGQLPIAGEL